MAIIIRNRWHYKGIEEGLDLWEWEAFLVGESEELSNVDYVEWILHPTFHHPIRKITNPQDGFILKESGYGEFILKAFVHTKDRKKLRLIHQLTLKYDHLPHI